MAFGSPCRRASALVLDECIACFGAPKEYAFLLGKDRDANQLLWPKPPGGGNAISMKEEEKGEGRREKGKEERS